MSKTGLTPSSLNCLSSFICSSDDMMWNSLNNLTISFWYSHVTFKCSTQKCFLPHLTWIQNHVTLWLKNLKCFYITIRIKAKLLPLSRKCPGWDLSQFLWLIHVIPCYCSPADKLCFFFFSLQSFAQAVLFYVHVKGL